MWLNFEDGDGLGRWLDNKRYTDHKRVIQFTLCRVDVTDKSAPISTNIAIGCGHCPTCFVLPAQVVQQRERPKMAARPSRISSGSGSGSGSSSRRMSIDVEDRDSSQAGADTDM